MSDDQDEAMSERIASILAGDAAFLDDDDDMDDDPDFEYAFDAEDMEDEMGDDDFYDEDDFYEDDDDEDGPDVIFTGDPLSEAAGDEDEDDEDDDDEEEEEDEDEEEGIAIQELAALFNRAPNAEARSSLLARLLGGPGTGGSRLSSSILRRLGATDGPSRQEERARALAERRRRERWWNPQFEPHPAGAELLRSGEFGRVRGWTGHGKGRKASRRCLTKRRQYIHTPSVTQVSTPCS
jgi:hypothetical protein